MSDLDEQTALLKQHEGFLQQNANHWLRMNPTLGFEDLMQEGRLALLVAFRSYDAEKGVKLLTYAQYFILRAMRGHAVRFSMPVHQSEAQFRRRTQSVVEVSRVALDVPIFEDSKQCLVDTLTAPESGGEMSEQADLMALVAKALLELKPMEREILKARFDEGLKLREIAKRYGMSHQRIAQIEGIALRKLRENRSLKYA